MWIHHVLALLVAGVLIVGLVFVTGGSLPTMTTEESVEIAESTFAIPDESPEVLENNTDVGTIGASHFEWIRADKVPAELDRWDTPHIPIELQVVSQPIDAETTKTSITASAEITLSEQVQHEMTMISQRLQDVWKQLCG